MSQEVLFSLLVIAGCSLLGLVALWAYIVEEPIPVEDIPDPWEEKRRKRPRYYVNGSTMDHAEDAARRRREQTRRDHADYGRKAPPPAPPAPIPWMQILGVDRTAGQKDIRSAYVRLMKGLHPDIAGQNAYTSERCAMVQEAYEKGKAEAAANGRR